MQASQYETRLLLLDTTFKFCAIMSRMNASREAQAAHLFDALKRCTTMSPKSLRRVCVCVTNGRSANITVEARFVSFDFDAIRNENDKKLSN